MWLMLNNNENAIEIKSPCNGDCFIDNSNKLCTGCYRTKEKEELLIKVESRRKKYESK